MAAYVCPRVIRGLTTISSTIRRPNPRMSSFLETGNFISSLLSKRILSSTRCSTAYIHTQSHHSCNTSSDLATETDVETDDKPRDPKSWQDGVCDSLKVFFDDPKHWGEKEVKTGRSWKLDELRIKSNTDLHKLWYVLLKERNMLLTMQYEAEMSGFLMPSEDRIEKVEISMNNLQSVVKERDDALSLLEKGVTTDPPGAYTWNELGFRYWRTFTEYAVPWWMNPRFRSRKYFYKPFVKHYMRLRLEKERAAKFAREQRKLTYYNRIKKEFPKSDIKLEDL